jgi:hypothetical protein
VKAFVWYFLLQEIRKIDVDDDDDGDDDNNEHNAAVAGRKRCMALLARTKDPQE